MRKKQKKKRRFKWGFNSNWYF